MSTYFDSMYSTSDVYGGAQKRVPKSNSPSPRAEEPRSSGTPKPEGSGRASGKPLTQEQRDRRRRASHLRRRSERHAQCRLSLRPTEKRIMAIKDPARRAAEFRKIALQRRQCARLSQEQSKRRLFMGRIGGFEDVDAIRTDSGYTISRSAAAKDLRKQKGQWVVNTLPFTNNKFEAWRAAMASVGRQVHPDGGRVLLAKSDGDRYERGFYAEVRRVYDRLLDDDLPYIASVKASVEKRNAQVKAHNDALFARSEAARAKRQQKKEEVKETRVVVHKSGTPKGKAQRARTPEDPLRQAHRRKAAQLAPERGNPCKEGIANKLAHFAAPDILTLTHFKQLAKLLHPDRNRGCEDDAKRAFQTVTEYYKSGKSGFQKVWPHVLRSDGTLTHESPK